MVRKENWILNGIFILDYSYPLGDTLYIKVDKTKNNHYIIKVPHTISTYSRTRIFFSY